MMCRVTSIVLLVSLVLGSVAVNGQSSEDGGSPSIGTLFRQRIDEFRRAHGGSLSPRPATAVAALTASTINANGPPPNQSPQLILSGNLRLEDKKSRNSGFLTSSEELTDKATGSSDSAQRDRMTTRQEGSNGNREGNAEGRINKAPSISTTTTTDALTTQTDEELSSSSSNNRIVTMTEPTMSTTTNEHQTSNPTPGLIQRRHRWGKATTTSVSRPVHQQPGGGCSTTLPALNSNSSDRQPTRSFTSQLPSLTSEAADRRDGSESPTTAPHRPAPRRHLPNTNKQKQYPNKLFISTSVSVEEQGGGFFGRGGRFARGGSYGGRGRYGGGYGNGYSGSGGPYGGGRNGFSFGGPYDYNQNRYGSGYYGNRYGNRYGGGGYGRGRGLNTFGFPYGDEAISNTPNGGVKSEGRGSTKENVGNANLAGGQRRHQEPKIDSISLIAGGTPQSVPNNGLLLNSDRNDKGSGVEDEDVSMVEEAERSSFGKNGKFIAAPVHPQVSGELFYFGNENEFGAYDGFSNEGPDYSSDDFSDASTTEDELNNSDGQSDEFSSDTSFSQSIEQGTMSSVDPERTSKQDITATPSGGHIFFSFTNVPEQLASQNAKADKDEEATDSSAGTTEEEDESENGEPTTAYVPDRRLYYKSDRNGSNNEWQPANRLLTIQ